MSRLTLKRPLVFFDIESTGVDPYTDRIVELCMVKHFPDGNQRTWTSRIHPCRPIPAAASAVHGITDEDVSNVPRFAGQVAVEVLDFITGCDFAGFGVRSYDIPLLSAELTAAGIPFDFEACRIVDAKDIFFKLEPRNLSAAVLRYCGREHEGAHGAMADTIASRDVLLAMLEQHEDLPSDVEGLSKVGIDPDAFDADGKLKWQDGELVVNFGKMKGKSLKTLAIVDRGYLSWMTRGAFSKKVVGAVADALRGQFSERVL